ncbi:MAG TPA: hypothetical protein VFH44_07480 [Solirubrobacterales bacterium]|nr:hypothetical protein [Solirubrobacterales bacterium]
MGGQGTEEIAPGLWSWARRHPEWHPGDFGAEVVAFMAAADRETLLIDPLLDDDDPAWELVAATGSGPVRVLLTITYHVRSAEAVRDRFRGEREVTIHGHPAVAKRLASGAGFVPFAPGDELPGGVSAHSIGKPRRYETPLLIPSHRALVFGDAVVGTDAGPRIWSGEKVDERVARFYAEKFAPTLLPLLELGWDRLLFTHGPSVLTGGKDGLREAIEAPVWHHRS